MNISGPFFDPSRRKSPKKWYLSYFVPKKHADGTLVLADGKPVLERKRPYYPSKEDAQADKPAILAQFAAAGVSPGRGVLTREQVDDYEHARLLVPEAPLAEVAKFWRMHHPLRKILRVNEVAPVYLAATLGRLGKTAGYTFGLLSMPSNAPRLRMALKSRKGRALHLSVLKHMPRYPNTPCSSYTESTVFPLRSYDSSTSSSLRPKSARPRKGDRTN